MMLIRLLLLLCIAASFAHSAQAPTRRPNIIFLLADDLGYGDIGAYGQTKIRTPNLDQLARDGMRFTQHYSGHNVCAPSRCVLMTAKHPGHAYIRENRGGVGMGNGQGGEGQEPVPAGELKLPLTLKQLGYTTGAFGKWGLGGVGSTGDPNRQGIDRFFGYNDQAVAHNFYPTSLWNNAERVPLKNEAFSAHQKLAPGADPKDAASYAKFAGRDYAPDRINEEARRFVRENKDRPFFLYYPTTVPHLALQVPEDSLAEYRGKFPETPYPGGRGYLPHPTPRAAYAAMVTRLDREIGRLLALVDEFGLRENTLVIFTSDNGGERLSDNGPYFNTKGTLWEGGIHVPGLARWPAALPKGKVSNQVAVTMDWTATILAAAGVKPDRQLDGINLLPMLQGKQPEQERTLCWRIDRAGFRQQAIRSGKWKLVTQPTSVGLLLFDLDHDPGERRNLFYEHQEKVVELRAKLAEWDREMNQSKPRFSVK